MEIDFSIVADAMRIAKRRDWLCKNVPSCEKCDERYQIQLRDWSAMPATWKCRICGFKFEFEPRVITYRNKSGSI